MDEAVLIEALRNYFASQIEDKDAFISSVLAGLNARIPEARSPDQAKQEIEVRRKKLLGKKDRYQEMYTNDLISMAELKEKIVGIAEELNALDMEMSQIQASSEILNDTERLFIHFRHEIIRFLELKAVTNMDMRQILDHISVDKDGNIRVVLKKI